MRYVVALLFLVFTFKTAEAQDSPSQQEPEIYTSYEKPLIVLQDGEKFYKLESAAINEIDPEWLSEVQVLKKESAVNIFGEEAGEGAIILVLTKELKPAKKYIRKTRRDNNKITSPTPKGVFRE